MQTYREPARDLPVVADVDVLVVGGGPSGFAAAVAAGRAGAATLLVEQTGAVGGVATSGMMSHWTVGGAVPGTEGPLLDELLERARDTDRDFNYAGNKVLKAKHIINPEKLKLVMLEMLEEAGVRLRLYTQVAAPIMAGDAIAGIVTESKSGREAIRAKVVVDASGDGDVAARAGAPFAKGRARDGTMQPMTVMFKVAGVDMERAIFPGEFDDNLEVPEGRIQDLGRQHLPPPMGHVLLYPTTLPGVVTVNMTNCIGVDGTDVDDISRAEVVCRRQIPLIVDFLHRFAPGYEHCFVVASAATIGVRETRHFRGRATITEEDIEQARVFDDWIATRLYFNFDIHNLAGPGLDPDGAQAAFRQTQRYTIPYGACVPEAVDGLLLNGRNISGTHKAHSNFRVMPIAVNLGQGVGTAAALAALSGTRPRDLAPAAIQAELMRQGVAP
jgi:ribulose 1,5-bisphosphate synthetase/thiazole synthase